MATVTTEAERYSVRALPSAISTKIVRLMRQYTGRGPLRARATIRDNVVLVMLEPQDDAIDQINRRILQATLELNATPAQRELATRHVLISRSVERIRDNAVDIGEQTAFLAAAELHEFNEASHPHRSRPATEPHDRPQYERSSQCARRGSQLARRVPSREASRSWLRRAGCGRSPRSRPRSAVAPNRAQCGPSRLSRSSRARDRRRPSARLGQRAPSRGRGGSAPPLSAPCARRRPAARAASERPL
jgi:hypothetical protein